MKKRRFYCNCCGCDWSEEEAKTTTEYPAIVCPECGCEYQEDKNYIEEYSSEE